MIRDVIVAYRVESLYQPSRIFYLSSHLCQLDEFFILMLLNTRCCGSVFQVAPYDTLKNF